MVERVTRSSQLVRAMVVLIFAAAVLTGCGGEDGDDDSDVASSCTPLAASEFGCQNPADCLATRITWNHADASEIGSADFDLTLWIDEHTFINADSVGGVCSHSGDVEAVGLERQSETITCDMPRSGSYRFIWSTFFVLDMDLRIDVNDRGDVLCSLIKEANQGDRTIDIP